MGIAAGLAIMFSLCQAKAFGQEEEITEEEFLKGMVSIKRMIDQRPFLKDSLDVIWEPQTLNKFFTDRIYEKLTGNTILGYTWDEGFACSAREVSIVEIKDLTKTYGAAYKLALEQALTAGGYKINPKADCQIGIAILGVEPKETDKTLPGVLVEAYLRNAATKKSYFIRYGTGSYEGLATALRTSTARLYSEIEERYNGKR
jgi:hypothetical protein